ncbi:MAG: glycosyltransferase [Candidatus Latescibacterota bacterium]|nr:MAG: glycosyltransferase [Candidatus Latescibacterota bacterium]
MLYSPAGCKAAGDGLTALRLAREKHPDMLGTLFGAARFPQGLSPWMDYRRNLSEGPLVALYNETSIFLCSSKAEGFPLPPVEAMASGCAVVTTDCGGTREYAEHGVTALVSPPGDPDALATNLRLLLEDDDLREKIASAGTERIRSYDWERSTDRLEALLQAGS